jgi:hypothetical protein
MRHLLTLLFVFVCLGHFLQAQEESWRDKFKLNKNEKKPLIETKVRQSGPYAGLQLGKYNALEVGGEMQWKRATLKEFNLHSITLGADYNIFEHGLGFSAGYYHKSKRVAFTYGGQLLYRSNFDESRFGVAPVIGYKILMLHAQLGFSILTPSETFKNTNTIFISVRSTHFNNRKRETKTRWSKDNKKD